MGKLKPNLPRSWHGLPQREKDTITKAITEQYYDQLNHEEAQIQKVWLKMGCIANHKVFGAGAIRGRRWLLQWKQLYRIISKCKTNEERDAYLDAEMEKIFGKDGYPSEWVDSLENGGRR